MGEVEEADDLPGVMVTILQNARLEEPVSVFGTRLRARKALGRSAMAIIETLNRAAWARVVCRVANARRKSLQQVFKPIVGAQWTEDPSAETGRRRDRHLDGHRGGG